MRARYGEITKAILQLAQEGFSGTAIEWSSHERLVQYHYQSVWLALGTMSKDGRLSAAPSHGRWIYARRQPA